MAERSPPVGVAVIVPFYRRELSEGERQSLRHLDAYLDGYDRIALVPESLETPRLDFRRAAFDDAFFTGVGAYSRLLLSADFYRAFTAYRYILIHQLDALVFADALEEWCRAAGENGWDYLGAPWLRDPEAPEKGFSRVGNGGLSLRRVEACLAVLESRRYVDAPVVLWRELVSVRLPDLADEPLARRWRRRARVLREARQGVEGYLARYTINEDRFWSDRAHLFDPTFRVAPVDAALSFAFERAPRRAFERSGGRWPFGCHGWERFDRPFWEPRLLPPPS